MAQRTKLEELTDISRESLEAARHHLEIIKSLSDVKLMYIHCYQLMKLGGLESEVPRLVVFGQQSMGKTTLLDFIMGGPIGYSSTDTGTKQPVSIIMKPSSSLITDGVALEPMKIVCKFNGQFMDIHDVQDAMRHHMQSLGSTILSEELEVEVYVPNAVYAIFVDLPGIKDDSKIGAELTRSVVRSYVANNPNDLYILVKKASDDPSNWPWSLKEFITSSAPAGLGLTPQQTMVVGTRAREFLLNEKTDIKTQEQLLERVYKRGVLDSKGQMLPLHLLELFSLSIEAKESGDFLHNRDEMRAQVSNSQRDVYELITNAFESVPVAIINDQGRTLKDELLHIFSIESFLKTLNYKFNHLMNTQLTNLERRLVRKKMELEREISVMESKLNRFSPQSLRESIKQFIRQFIEIVHNMLTGNYTIMKLPIPADQFLSIYGGSLKDNLEDGHELALNLFPMPDMYDPDFYNKITSHTESLYRKRLTMMDSIKPGRYVRYFTNRINSNMFGLIEPPCRVPPTNSSESTRQRGTFEIINRDYGPDELINVEFIQINNGIETSLHKNIDRNKLVLLTPLPSISVDNLQVPLYAWHKTQASTGWILVRPIVIDRLPPEILVQKSNYREVDIANKQISFRYLDETETTAELTPTEEKKDEKKDDKGKKRKEGKEEEKEGKKDETGVAESKDRYGSSSRFLYFTTCSEIYLEENNTAPYYNSALEMVSGEHADAHLLNQLAFTNICHWLKFHIKHMEPEQINTAEVLYQMLRSIHHVVDRVDWEPLVADLVQSNVGGTLLHAARLSACAAAAALRRILRASLSEIFRCVQLNDIDHTLIGLSESLHFQEQIDQLSEEYCRHKALECANAMKSLIMEQTYSVQFDVAVDIFDSCYQFEKYFMGRAGHRSHMADALQSVRENLSLRKRRLAMTDIFEKCDAQTSIELIYEEVKVQFWATKMLLSSPLTSKIYSHFIKQVVDKKPLSSSDPATTNIEAELEEFLQSHILYEYVDGNLVAKSNARLSADYDLDVKFDRYLQRYNRTKHILEYVTYALEGINKFKHYAHSEEVVNFLSHLGFKDV